VNFWMAALVAAAGIVVFLAWANRQTAKAHARFTAKDVDDALSELLAPDARDHDIWDLFLAWPIDDPDLESIRQECLKICRECPPVPGKDMKEDGERRVESHDYDVKEIVRALKQAEASGGRKLVRLPPRRSGKRPAKGKTR
jgi:hypothetical protein